MRFLLMEHQNNNLKSLLTLTGFIVLVVGAGFLIGISTAPGPWFSALDKPPFNPPSWLFAPVWTILYVMIAIAGFRSYRRAPTGRAMQLWGAQMVLNWAWSIVFFSAHMIWAAFAVIFALWVLIAGFVALNRRQDPVSALLFVPYFAWVSFAALLNFSIGILN